LQSLNKKIPAGRQAKSKIRINTGFRTEAHRQGYSVERATPGLKNQEARADRAEASRFFW